MWSYLNVNRHAIECDSPATMTQQRFVSLDALRGFDMFWIVGGDYLIRSLQKVHDSPATRWLANQMEHCEWAGFHFYDLIFPLFVFLVGAAIPFSIQKIITQQGRAGAVRRIFIRSLVLFLLGIFYMGGVANGFKNVYLAGVLHRIALAYFFCRASFLLFQTAHVGGIHNSFSFWLLGVDDFCSSHGSRRALL